MMSLFQAVGSLFWLSLIALGTDAHLTLCKAQGNSPAKRVALVIGNSHYQHAGVLLNPKNDATDIAAALEKVGFGVILATDLDKSNMERTIRRFAQAAKGAHTSLLFYAGHGIQVAGQNYLVPIDAKLNDASGLDFELVRADLVQRTMEREASTNLLFLDACRDNPLARNLARAMGTRSVSIGRGLAAVESGIGTLISFSTQPGNAALDGEGRNSPYAAALVSNLNRAGQDISSLLISVRREVMAATSNAQVPWEHSALTERFFFAEPGTSNSAKGADSVPTPPAQVAALPMLPVLPPTPTPALPTYEQQAELALWGTIKDSRSAELYQSYLERFPNGIFAPAARILLEQTKGELALKSPSAGGTAIVPDAHLQSPSIAPSDMQRLALDLQRELVRVGCFSGPQDGRWGNKSKQALIDFVRHAKIAMLDDTPSADMLGELKKRTQRVCPLACGDDEIERDGKCAAKYTTARPEPQRPERREQSTSRRTSSSESRPKRDNRDSGAKSSGSGTCWSTEVGGRQLVSCDDPRSSGRRAF